MTRRDALKTTALAAAACALGMPATAQTNLLLSSAGGLAVLPPLPYPYDALEPSIDARTMEIHHDKHHAGYVANLNKALADSPELRQKPLTALLRDLDSIPEKIRAAVRNNGGGHYNHSLFWRMMKKNGGGRPKGELAKAIDRHFGSFNAFKDHFTKAALGRFGSGWAWLSRDGQVLRIESTANQNSPISQNRQPLLGIDVWEHAYYLKYQNRRADYIGAWFDVINWDFVSERFAHNAEA